MVNQKQTPVTTYKSLVVLFASVPGYVFLLLGWLAIAVTLLYALTTKTRIFGPAQTQEPAQPLFVIDEITSGQGVIMIVMTIAIWLGIAIMVRRFVNSLARKMNDPIDSRHKITLGGVSLAWLIVAIASLLWGLDSAVVLFSVAVGFIGIASFALEQWLANKWKIKLI